MSKFADDSGRNGTEITPEKSLAQLAREEKGQFVAREFWQFLKESGKWWLLPLVVVLVCIGLFFLAAQTGLAPYLYAFW